jgi:ribosomal protein S18 acetylase RimI-like enzyme
MTGNQSELLPAIQIRHMRKEELTFAAECTMAEGWVSENLTTLEGFYLHDPQGCWLAEGEGHPIGICIATSYGTSGFIGELIVHPSARGRGVGAALLNHAVGELKSRGAESVYLDGVIQAVELYERNGFRKIWRSWRYNGTLRGKIPSNVRRMTVDDLAQVIELDKRSFGAVRGFFLKRRFELFPELSYVLLHRNQVAGFMLGRGGEDWISAGPWVVEEFVEHPENVLVAIAHTAAERPIIIGILESHPHACDLVQSLGFTARADSPWRMVLGNSTQLGASSRCYAIGSPAKG